jgi:serine/threonine protein phosphatase PrpC
MIMVQAAGFSDIGKVRKANEDCFLLNEPIGLYVVADGMGGHRGGGIASRIAIETIDGYMATPSQEPFLDTDGTNTVDAAESGRHTSPPEHFLANQKIYTQSVADKACRGMGTTVSALYLVR